ncbi:tyrosine-type recombinase/integrase [Leptospira barantonii]|uniref:Site-specific recombinase n=1 Tax=Leptospira barantonii TaxID=2023184 RepID=A0ABX4NNM1_9LEPT|nr:tyrosine-type recombinase/integrase [Leptospira barantonii]PJZ57222.1 site-specific recombinase [Leptospira barantonii]
MDFRLERNGRFLLVRFPYHQGAYDWIRTLPNAKWNSEKKFWIFPFSESLLENFLSLRNAKVTLEGELELFYWIRKLKLSNASRRTIRSYHSNVLSFLKWSGKNPKEVTKEDLNSFLEFSFLEKGQSSATVTAKIQSLNSYFGVFLGKPWFKDLPRPKREQKLPDILSTLEVYKILNALENPKHKLLLSFCYASGLRVSELVHLKPKDIDEKRKTVKIREGKGKKDRFTMLSQACLSLWEEFRVSHPYEEWIFPGQDPSKPIHIRTAEKIFENAKSKAGITKDVSIHSLRHAFATHLLEAGTNIKHIQFLLGHKSVRTTEIYTRVSQVRVTKIESPLDSLSRKSD